VAGERWKKEAGAVIDDPGSGILCDIESFLSRFVAYPCEHARVAHVLWIAHTHLMDAWDSTPRIAFLSPEPSSGKSRALEVSELLVPRPIEAINVTPAYLFRKVADEDGRPTILYDEIDTVFGPKARENEEIRGLLNAGHRKHSMAGRCVVRGKQVFTEEIPAYCAVALAGLGNLPDTIIRRSVVIRMRRRSSSELIEPYRRRQCYAEGVKLRGRLAAWAESIESTVTKQWPEMPETVRDRDADVWEALLAVANAAGGNWPQRANVAAVTIVTLSQQSTPSLGIQLLADLRKIFGDREGLHRDTVLRELIDLDESPWRDIRGKQIDSRELSRILRKYEIKQVSVREDSVNAKGYRRSDLADVWDRYLPCVLPDESGTSDTNDTNAAEANNHAGSSVPLCQHGSGTNGTRSGTPTGSSVPLSNAKAVQRYKSGTDSGKLQSENQHVAKALPLVPFVPLSSGGEEAGHLPPYPP
jgi:hypothetical protein